MYENYIKLNLSFNHSNIVTSTTIINHMKKTIALAELTPEHVDKMSDEDVVDLIYLSLDQFCIMLEDKGIPGEYIDPVLLGLFGMRMSESASRDEYEEMLQDALDEPWLDSPTFH